MAVGTGSHPCGGIRTHTCGVVTEGHYFPTLNALANTQKKTSDSTRESRVRETIGLEREHAPVRQWELGW